MKQLNSIVLLILAVLFQTGCNKAPLNGKIEQHWQLEQFTILETGEIIHCERLYYGITRMVTEIAEKQGKHDYGTFIARTEYGEDGNVLILKEFRVRMNPGDPSPKATAEQLKPFGIINPDLTTFLIQKSTNKRLILQSDYARLELKRF